LEGYVDVSKKYGNMPNKWQLENQIVDDDAGKRLFKENPNGPSGSQTAWS
jgi:hypothetical protein